MRRLNKIALAVFAVPILVLAYFSDNIRGYYRFKQLCDGDDAGLKVFHPLRRDVGWFAGKGSGHIGVVRMEEVAFVRYADGGALYDMRYRSGPRMRDASYDITPADERVPVAYELRHFSERLPGELRLSRSGYGVYEVVTGRLMLRWHQYGYSSFDRDRTLFAAPSGQTCHFFGEFWDKANTAKYFTTTN